jgi:hypothetical protein
MAVIITKEKIKSRDYRLNRHIHHDSRSLNYAYDTKQLSIISITHSRSIPILDQGNVGSCVGNAGIGNIASGDIFTSLPSVRKYTLDEPGAVKLYSDAEVIDGWGPYPPNDFGSTGLSCAKALVNAGLISGYQHAFTSDDAIKACSQHPFIFGTNWYTGMFNTDKDGRVRISGQIAGGHEILCRQIDAVNKRVWFDNSWGTSWGLAGRFYLTFDDFKTLLAQQGDVIIPLPMTQAGPTPSVTPSADTVLAAAMRAWLTAKGL